MAYMCKIRSLYSHSVTRTPPLQTHHFAFRHYFHIDSITSNSDIEAMPIKHRIAIFINYSLRCYLIVSRSESWIITSWLDVKGIISLMFSHHWRNIKAWSLCFNTYLTLGAGHLHFEMSCYVAVIFRLPQREPLLEQLKAQAHNLHELTNSSKIRVNYW